MTLQKQEILSHLNFFREINYVTKLAKGKREFLIFPRCTVWKLPRFSLTHSWQKFRESNVFTKEITKELIWRNIFLVRLNLSFFHTVGCDKCEFHFRLRREWIFREINFQNYSTIRWKLFSRNFLLKKLSLFPFQSVQINMVEITEICCHRLVTILKSYCKLISRNIWQ